MLPYGYSVSLLLAVFPPIWKRVIDPMAHATNNNVKLSEETKADIERWVLITLVSTSIALTWVMFFGVGINV